MGVPRAAIERIMRRAGAERVSEDAVEMLKEAVDGVADEVAEDAVKQSKKAGRDAISRQDVREASK